MIADSPFRGKVFVVGGSVRDQLLGIDSADVDLLVVGSPDAGIDAAVFVAKHLGIYNELSNPVIYQRYGTAMLHLPDELQLEFVGSGNATGTIQQIVAINANERDFTINSLLQDLESGEILDPTGKAWSI